MAFEGIHPTFRHVPPRAPRFSTQAVCIAQILSFAMTTKKRCPNDVHANRAERLWLQPRILPALPLKLSTALMTTVWGRRTPADYDDIIRLCSRCEPTETSAPLSRSDDVLWSWRKFNLGVRKRLQTLYQENEPSEPHAWDVASLLNIKRWYGRKRFRCKRYKRFSRILHGHV